MNLFPNLWLRITPFHLETIIIEILGHYTAAGRGIEEIIVHDLKLYGENTYKSILNEHYNMGTCLHQMIYENIRTI